MIVLDDGLQIWTDFEGASGTHLHTIAGAEVLEDFVTVNGREDLTLQLPRNSAAWDHIAKRRVIRVEFDDGTIDEYRIAKFDEVRSTKEYSGIVTGEGAIMELNGPGICELIYDSGDVVHTFDLLSMTVDDHLDEVILLAGPSWITKGTVDPTALVDLTYDQFTPLRALQALLEATVTERHLIRQAGGAYEINVLDQRGGAASVPVIQLGKNLRSSARETDDRETRTRIYPVGADTEFGQARIQDARWIVLAVETTIDWVIMSVTQRGRLVEPAWQDDVLNGFYVGNPDGTEIQEILDTVESANRIFVADASLYAAGEELQLYETAAGKRLAFLEDQAQTSSDTDRRPEAVVYNDLPAARNFVLTPRLDAYTGGNPDNWSDVGTPTTSEEVTTFAFRDIGASSLHMVCDAAEEGTESDAITLVPTADSPYFTAWVKIWIVSGRVRFQLNHSVLGVFPPLQANEIGNRVARSNLTGAWVELIIQPGTDHLLPAGTVQLQVLSDGGTAEFYLDGAMLTQTAALPPFMDGQPAVELYDRAKQRFLTELVSTEVTRYTLGVDDLSDLVLPFDGLTVGGDVEVDDPDLGIDVTTRMKSLRRDLRHPAIVGMELDDLRGRFTESAIRRRLRVPVDPGPSRAASIEVTQIDLLIDETDGSVIMRFEVGAEVRSIRYATAVGTAPGWPSDATVEAGTIVTGTGSFDVTLAAGTIDPLETLRVRVAPYLEVSGLGPGGAVDHGAIAAQEVAWRPQRGTAPKTIRIGHSEFVPFDDNNTNFTHQVGHLDPRVLGSTETFNATIVLPRGVTITAVRARLYRVIDSAAYISIAEFFRVNDDATATSLATLTHTGTGFATFSSVISEVVAADKHYAVRAQLEQALALGARHLWFEIDYDMDDFLDAY